jgi:hypothetical protein
MRVSDYLVLHTASCSELRERLEQAKTLLHHIELDIRDTEYTLRIDSRDFVREHYEWLKRKRAEVESEIGELERVLRVYAEGEALRGSGMY